MKHFTIKLTLAFFCLTAFAFNCKSQIYGTNSVLSISANTATVVDPLLTITQTGNITDINVQISGGYVIGSSGDILAYTGSLPSGVSAIFDNNKGVLSFTGTASASAWQALLRTVTIKTTSNSCYSSKRGVTFVIGNKLYNPSNGHYYAESYYNTWSNAKATASASTYYGREGYLATITSADESSFVFVNSNFNCWIGASDNYVEINAATGTSTFANQVLAEGNFYWVTGPEKGTPISTKNSWESGGTVAVSGSFINWNVAEPNDYPDFTASSPGQEDFVQFYSNNGKWNDNIGSASVFSLIEYGDMPNDIQNLIPHSTRNILINGAPTGNITGDVYVCTGSNSATFTLNPPSGSGFSVTRWESSTDQFFANPTSISNTTTTLNLTGLTQNAYYRAIINKGSCSNLPTSSSKVILNNANGTWQGTYGYNWQFSLNWCGGKPTSITDVIIPSGTEFSPNIDGDAECRNIKLYPGSLLSFDINKKLEIYGTINSNNSINSAAAEISLRGTSSQVLSTSALYLPRIKRLTINNSSTNGVVLNGSLLVTDILTLTNGLLTTTASDLLTLDDGANNISGGSSTNYINGPLKKVGKSNGFVFQIGKDGKWAPCALDNYSNNSNSQYFTAEYFKNPFNPFNMSGLGRVSGKEMWNISRSGTSSVSLTLYSYNNAFSGITSTTTNDLIVAHWNNSGYWEDLGGTRSTSTAGGLTTVTMAGVNSFSPFTFGSPSGLNALPVKLINFVAIPDNVTKTVDLNWETASEENSKYFEIMYSADMLKWTSIGKVNAKGGSNQLNSYTFRHMNPSNLNHYKLKEVANNGDYSYSDIKLVRFTDLASDNIIIYPNPSTGNITLANASEETNYEIIDITGKVIQTGNFSQSIVIQNIPKGVYIVKLISEGSIQNEKIVIQ